MKKDATFSIKIVILFVQEILNHHHHHTIRDFDDIICSRDVDCFKDRDHYYEYDIFNFLPNEKNDHSYLLFCYLFDRDNKNADAGPILHLNENVIFFF